MRCLLRVAAAAALVNWGALAADLPITGKLVQKPDTYLETHVGGVVFTVNRTSPLPNVLGKPDIFGRKVDRGFVQVRYRGKAPDGKLVFTVTDVETRSNETTMNRTPVAVTSSTAQASTNAGSVVVHGSSTTVYGQAGRTESLPPDTTEFAVDPTLKSEFRIADVGVLVIVYDELTLRYRLSWVDPKRK
jgi:hypothetical protein